MRYQQPTTPQADLTEIQAAQSGNNVTPIKIHGKKSPYGEQGGDVDFPNDRAAGLRGQFNRAAQLKPGHLLISLAARNAVFQVDPETGTIEYLFTLAHQQEPFLWRVLADARGMIYCALSGSRDFHVPTEDAIFGLAGAIAIVDIRSGEIEVLASGEDVVDPCSIQILDELTLCVSDFRGFGGTGQIYLVDRLTGERRVIAQGQPIVDPVSAHVDRDGRIWVANSFMHYFYPRRGHSIQKDDGEVLCIDGDQSRVVLPRHFPAKGSVVGIHPADNEHIIVIKGDWPLMQNSAVLLLHKESGVAETLLQASTAAPRFFSTHVDLDGGLLWVGESYRKEIICYDLQQRAIVKTIPMTRVMGAYHGVASSFEGMESVSIVPHPTAVAEDLASNRNKQVDEQFLART